MKLIDADSLFNWGKHKLSDATKYGNKGADQTNFSYSTLMMYEIADEINVAPTVDAVPVVRCGECKFWENDGMHITGICSNANVGKIKLDTDFCSYGVRKDGMK